MTGTPDSTCLLVPNVILLLADDMFRRSCFKMSKQNSQHAFCENARLSSLGYGDIGLNVIYVLLALFPLLMKISPRRNIFTDFSSSRRSSFDVRNRSDIYIEMREERELLDTTDIFRLLQSN